MGWTTPVETMVGILPCFCAIIWVYSRKLDNPIWFCWSIAGYGGLNFSCCWILSAHKTTTAYKMAVVTAMTGNNTITNNTHTTAWFGTLFNPHSIFVSIQTHQYPRGYEYGVNSLLGVT
jgi:hypothetical protein